MPPKKAPKLPSSRLKVPINFLACILIGFWSRSTRVEVEDEAAGGSTLTRSNNAGAEMLISVSLSKLRADCARLTALLDSRLRKPRTR